MLFGIPSHTYQVPHIRPERVHPLNNDYLSINAVSPDVLHVS